MTDLLKKIYSVFDPAPLLPEQDNLYVSLDEVRGSTGLVNELSKHILLSQKPTCQLLAGHRGSGKSTELRQLQTSLESEQNKFFTVFCETEKEDEREGIDPNDVDFPDVLMFVIYQLAKQLRERVEIELKPGYFRDRWDELKNLLGSKIDFSKLELSVGLAKFSAAIKDSPDTRLAIRKALEPKTNTWISAANDVIGEAVLELSKKDYSGLVIIVDGLDKITPRPHEKAGCSLPEYLFIHRYSQLIAFKCHLVYTIPISLAYSCKERNLSSLYGFTSPPVVPMTKINDEKGRTVPKGIEKFKDMVHRRLQAAGADENEVFANETVLDKIIRCSGGQPRELMTLIRDSLVAGDLPITEDAVSRTARNITHAYGRQLRKEHWKVINQVKKNHNLDRTEKNDELCMDLLESRAVLQYRNEKQWYDANPLLPEPPKEK